MTIAQDHRQAVIDARRRAEQRQRQQEVQHNNPGIQGLLNAVQGVQGQLAEAVAHQQVPEVPVPQEVMLQRAVEFAQREMDEGRPIQFADQMIRGAGGLRDLPAAEETDVSDDEDGPVVRRLNRQNNAQGQQR